MNREALIDFIYSSLRRISDCGDGVTLDASTPILGRDGLLSSMQLVELMLELEDYCREHGMDFDWANDAIFSTRHSVYRSIGTLADALMGNVQGSASS